MLVAMIRKRLSLLAATGGAITLYFRYLRERHMTWGATRAEAIGPLPGDELLPYANVFATRAVEIDAPPPEIWPWLVKRVPVDDLNVGSELRISGYTMRAEIVDPDKTLAFRSVDDKWAWSLELVPVNGHTRLVSRNRFDSARWTAKDRVNYAVMEPGSWVKERKMLLEIKRRAESKVSDTAPQPEATQHP
jgi:hypothetical protein